jgi:serine/threonine-protein kinase
VLPESFQANASRLARFEREARLLAALNHPGIASIYGLEHSDGGPLLVLELVEGATLSERLRRGPLPLREALDVGRQIAAALDAAHEKGIIHRDLKPSNVKLTPDGKVKLLDFGLAKALEPEVPADEVSKDPTETSPTSGGAVLGTAPYMSPEQARGETADKRTDVWSFGCVLYEALTGKRAFPGPTTSDTVAAVLDREPDWRALPEATPPLVRSLLGRCLQKDKGRRLRDIADARIEIEEALAQPAVAIARPDVAPTRRRLRILAAAVVAASLGAATVWILERGRPPNTHAPRRFNVQLPSAAPLFDGPRGAPTNTPFAVSPDGTFLLYLAEGPPRKLYVRPLERLAARAIPGTEGAYNPFFSPDGRWIGFTADGKLKKVRVDGGPPSTICDASQLRGASWAEDGTIVFTPRSEGGLARVSAEGGSPETLTTPVPAKEGSHRWPQYLPGARLVLFTITSASGRQDEGRIAILSTGERLMEVKVTAEPQFRARQPRIRFAARFADAGLIFAPPYDIAPDGQRFVASLEGEATKERVDIVAVPDWFEELKARVPAPSR